MITYPLNRIEYQATDAELFHCTRYSGIYSGEDFRPSVSGVDNIVNISEGIGWIRNSKFAGKVVCEKITTSVDLGLADASLPRWDVVCLQFDKNNNATEIVVKNGTPASSPLLPEISQTETLYELYICKVYRNAGAVSVTAGDVTDLRLDPIYCGLMADSVTSIDTDAIYNQAMALIETLQREISNASLGDKGINEYTASGSILDLNLSGVGANGKFKSNVSGTVENIMVNGVDYKVLAGGETEIELAANTWYFFILDTDDATINFKGGGGISNTALAATTADVADTLINKTFYSKDKVLKTGTMPDKSGTTQAATASLDATNSRLQITIPATGKYTTSSKLYTAYSTIRSLIGLTAAKIATGISILGITGTYKGVGNAIAGEVLAGRTFSTTTESGATGTMVNNASYTQALSAAQGEGDVYVRIPLGAYINPTDIGYPEIKVNNEMLANAIGLTDEKILAGNTILDVNGTGKNPYDMAKLGNAAYSLESGTAPLYYKFSNTSGNAVMAVRASQNAWGNFYFTFPNSIDVSNYNTVTISYYMFAGLPDNTSYTLTLSVNGENMIDGLTYSNAATYIGVKRSVSINVSSLNSLQLKFLFNMKQASSAMVAVTDITFS